MNQTDLKGRAAICTDGAGGGRRKGGATASQQKFCPLAAGGYEFRLTDVSPMW
jgi:hypothetical protein